MSNVLYGAVTFLVVWTILGGQSTYALWDSVHLAIGGVNAQCNAPIRLGQGLVLGEELVSTNGAKFCSFRKIPYAKAPVEALRFQPPVAAGPWTGILNATTDGPPCPQVNFLTGVGEYNEDCLTLNVYTRRIPRRLGFRRPLPVLVFIHGGGFAFGDAGLKTYPPHRIMEEPVVLVVPQYRLGAFGFLSTGSADASGNYGLLDQKLALQWVRANIAKFGGDPRRVTIFGESAGSASVMYQMISRRSRGLFSCVIAQSGTVLNHWSLQKDPYPYALELGQAVQCNSSNDRGALVECLRHTPVQAIIGAMVAKKWFNSILGPFVPVLEDPAYGKFLTENPKELLEKGEINDVPLIIGTMKHEMAIVFFGLPIASIFNTIDDNFSNVLLPNLINLLTKLRTNLLERSQEVMQQYFNKIDVNNPAEVKRIAIQFLTDLGFNAGTSLTARLLARRGFRVYKYLFEHAGNVSLSTFSGEKDTKHGDDLSYFFNTKNLTAGDQAYSRKLIKIWTNFGSWQNPTPFGLFRGLRWSTTGRREKLRQLIFGEDLINMAVQSDESLEADEFNNRVFPYSIDPNE